MQLLNGLAWTSQKPLASSEKNIKKITVATQAMLFVHTDGWFTTTKQISQYLILKRAKLKEEDAARWTWQAFLYAVVHYCEQALLVGLAVQAVLCCYFLCNVERNY